jgi:hypothetical protein
MKDDKTTGEAFSFQPRTSSTSKHEISELFNFILLVFFALLAPDSESGSPELIESGSKTLPSAPVDLLLEY